MKDTSESTGKRRSFASDIVSSTWINLPGILLLSLFTWLSVHIYSRPSVNVRQVDVIDVVNPNTYHSLFGSLEDNHFTDFSFLDIPLVLFIVALWALVYFFLGKLQSRFSGSIQNASGNTPLRTDQKFLFMVVGAAILIAAWLPYLLTWFPGGIFKDTDYVINQINGDTPISNQHTLLYLGFWRMFLSIFGADAGGSVETAAIAMGFFQLMMCAIVLMYVVYWLYRSGANKVFCIVTFVCFALIPEFPMSIVTLWKDLYFAIFLVLFFLKYIDLVRVKAPSASDIVVFCILSIMVSFTRNNGIYVVILSILAMMILKRKSLAAWRRFLIACAAIAVFALIVQGPVYSALGVQASFVESLGIPLQQLAAVVAQGGDLTESQTEYLATILPIDVWKSSYAPFLNDTIKFNSDFNGHIIEEDKGLFLSTFVQVGLQNPGIYLNSYLLSISGYYDPMLGLFDDKSAASLEHGVGGVYWQLDLMQMMTGFSLKGILEPRIFITCGMLVWLMVICTTLRSSKTQQFWRGLLLFAPMIGLWLTLLIAAPIAFSLRYLLTFVYAAPVMIYLVFAKSQLLSDGEAIDSVSLPEEELTESDPA